MTVVQHSLRLTIELSTNIHARETRERCPNIRFTEIIGSECHDLGAMRADVEKPRLDLPDGSQDSVVADLSLSRVIDEQAWLAELARLISPGGTLALALPASGPLAWYDTLNTYRYVCDIIGRGNAPDATFPTGWNRHYSEDDATTMLIDAGFTGIRIERVGLGLAEMPQMAGLMIGNFLLRRRDAELRLHPLRRAFEHVDVRLRAPRIGTTLAITATRAHAEPDDPAEESVSANEPAKEIDSE
jgi:SAM-dependent methyltransferase